MKRELPQFRENHVPSRLKPKALRQANQQPQGTSTTLDNQSVRGFIPTLTINIYNRVEKLDFFSLYLL